MIYVEEHACGAMDYFPVVVGSDLPTRAICTTVQSYSLYIYVCCVQIYTVPRLLITVASERGREREGLLPLPPVLYIGDCPT